MRHLASIASAALFGLALLAPARAHATAEFPGKIVTDLGITCANPIWDGSGCTICHSSNAGGLGTATQPFGVYMKTNGLTAFNDTQLQTLLSTLNAENPHKTDTNCDGKPDIDQLTTCDWQSLSVDACGGDGGTGVPPAIFYGCTASPAPAHDEPAFPASIAIGVAGALALSIFRAKTRKR